MKKSVSRRSFLKALGYGTCGGVAHSMGASAISPFRAISTAEASPRLGSQPTVIMVNFRGGFPLCTVPSRDGYFVDRFQELANIDTALDLDGNQALHPELTGLKAIWDLGRLAVVNNVGYHNPNRGIGVNRSHADSSDIFFDGRPDLSNPSEGWAVRFTNQMQSSFSGISVGGTNLLVDNANYIRSLGSLESLGERFYRYGGSSSTQEEHFKRQRDLLLSMGNSGNFGNVPLIRSANENIDATVEVLRQQTDPDTNPIPDEALFRDGNQLSNFCRQCRDAARIMNAPVLRTRFIYLERGGFDTHNGEQASLTNNLEDWNRGIWALWENLRQMGRLDDAIFVTMSEFGRTSFRNGSGGSDHGHACPWMIFGGHVRGGIKNPRATLADLTSGGSYIRNVDVEFPSLLRQIVERMGFAGDSIFPNYARTNLDLFT